MAEINNFICQFITSEWLQPWLDQNQSQRSFADKCNVEESIIRKIKGKIEYRIPVETLQKICEGHNMNLSQFFKEVEEMFPEVKIRK